MPGSPFGAPLGVPLFNPYTSTPTANPLGAPAPAASATSTTPWYKDPKFWLQAVLMGGSAYLNNRQQGQANATANRQVTLNDENEKARLGLDRDRFGQEKIDLERKRQADAQSAPYRMAVLQALLGRLNVPRPGQGSGLTAGPPMPAGPTGGASGGVTGFQSTAGSQTPAGFEEILRALGGGY